MTTTEAQCQILYEGIGHGLSQSLAARGAGISLSTAKRILNGHGDHKSDRMEQWSAKQVGDPLRVRELGPDALRARDDFAYFQRRYIGKIAMPWQVHAANTVVELLQSPVKEFCVINAPPGAGKTSTFTHDIPLWLTCRNRGLRGLIGSATSRLAATNVARLRRSLQDTIQVKADQEDIDLGVALDAQSTVAHDFGRFKPMDHETWTKDAFLVMQYDGVSITEKEPTWTAVGRDQEFIGGRYDFCMWDDLVTPNRLRSEETIEKDRAWWDSYAERRLEPKGLLILQGQRMEARDLYRYCLDMEVPEPSEAFTWDEATQGYVTGPRRDSKLRKYHHLRYKAHYDELCNPAVTHHPTEAKPWPDGCLLYPERLPWNELGAIKLNHPGMFETVYQQEDVSAADVLVNPDWISGAGNHPGCWDNNRDRLEIPQGLAGEFFSVVSCDPSPSKFWAIEWWLYHPESEQRFLIDLERRAMEAGDFLDWNYNDGHFTGVMEEWQQTSIDLGVPITHWIVETVSAERFLLQYDHVRRWMARRNVEIIRHSTHRNKSDADFGVQTIAPHYKFGRVRLPGKGEGRLCSLKLIDEVTKWPHGGTDDCVMSHWFFEWQLPHIYEPELASDTNAWRPSWLRPVAA